ncbi:serine/threonine-protein kinase RsbW [Neobacillus bataviensis]|jgi:serine/threonine-protein kinase RsbW|uniref:Serine-protein kinase RsbW n=1 Tax=Neobacillus bataviensis TaxID=220685 RepID=A0A561D7V7_9BACI|nr:MULTISPECIES: anti-sigma B factor RsbW [Neobacillus]MCM3729826.1 anti-sigma B factor RsbW [Neobacillus cucumis]TWD99430.1 serine/threonine-protein kinase RsbW [Neobacillus bataviensis]
MKQVMDYIEMKIPAKPDYVGVIRLTLSGITSRMGYTYEEIEDIKIAVSEACTNAVQHAYGDEEGGEVTLGFGIYEDKLEIMVADSGVSFNFIKTRNELGPYTESSTVEQLSEGGLGLFLIETLMDEVRVLNHSGVTVFMAKYLSGERENNGTAATTHEAN